MKVHIVKINGKDYPFAFCQSAMNRAHAMPGARDSELVLQYSLLYQCIKKGCQREGVVFLFPEGAEGVDAFTDFCSTDKEAVREMMKIMDDAMPDVKAGDDDAKKNSLQTKSNSTHSDTSESQTTSSQSQEQYKTSLPDNVSVT